jgi:hypothetical protein
MIVSGCILKRDSGRGSLEMGITQDREQWRALVPEAFRLQVISAEDSYGSHTAVQSPT